MGLGLRRGRYQGTYLKETVQPDALENQKTQAQLKMG